MSSVDTKNKPAVAEQVAAWLAATQPKSLSPATVDMARKLFVDVSGLCVAARREDYIAATLAAI
jgi:2-methylcitrate dehydratase PrpD